jgi:hypothetical protein
MTEPLGIGAGGIAKRDYLLLPLVSVLTVLAMFCITEAVTRVIWSSHDDTTCVIDGYQVKPNCTSRTKAPEGPWATYRFNECAYRSNTSCGPVPPGTVRIAILGASVSQGLNVPYEDTYFARSADELGRRCGLPIDVQNLGKPNLSPIYAYRGVDEVLKLKPDVVLFLLAPFDIEQQIDAKELAERNDPARVIAANAVYEPLSLMRRLQILIAESRTVVVAEHFLLKNRDTYLRLYLHYGDKADFLRQPFSSAWARRFADMDLIIGGMADKLRAAGVPFIVIPVPSRAEAALLSMPQPPPGTDGAAFGKTIEQIAAAHGAGYVDLMEPFSAIPDSQNLFLIVDGHVSPDGEKVIAKSLTEKLLDGSIPAFAQCGARYAGGGALSP